MIKYYLTITLCLFLSFLKAGKAGAFEFIYDTQSFPIEQSIIDSFKGTARLTANNALLLQPTPQNLLPVYFGRGKSSSSDEPAEELLKYRPERIYAYLKTLSLQINRPPVEPILEIKNDRVTNFSPPQNGLTLNLFNSTFAAIEALDRQATSSALVVEINPPQTSLAETNTLGINQLLATGESDFKGSPKNRVHNIKVGIGKFKGVIIKPGEEFSFNKYLGPVEAEAGFLPELVIKSNGTVPELGGGLCQVSTTVFRAAMNTGLPITQRKNHSYAVQYYAPQGTDATIYPGSVDLKFVNDTPGHILIWPYIKDTSILVFEFYGTPDNRKVTLLKPVQYDKKADGSLKAEWTRVVEKNFTVSTSTFKSTYLPPALFHKQEIYPTTTPATNLSIPAAN